MKRLALLAASAAFSLSLSGPAGAAGFFDKLLSAGANDIAAASLDAHAHADEAAYTCYDGTLAYFASQAGTSSIVAPGPVVGVVSAFQDARDVVKAGEGVYANYKSSHLLPRELERACGWYALDIQGDVSQIGAATGLNLLGFLHL